MSWQSRAYLFAGGLLLIFAAYSQLKAGHIAFDNAGYRQNTFAASGYGVGALLILLAFLPSSSWVYRHITTKRSRWTNRHSIRRHLAPRAIDPNSNRGTLKKAGDNQCTFGSVPSHEKNGFPDDFKVQRIGVRAALAIADLPPEDVAAYFRSHLETAEALLTESYDKRFEPSSFIKEENDGFSVGWFSQKNRYQCIQHFSHLADAAADYLLFSLGKERWTNPEDYQH